MIFSHALLFTHQLQLLVGLTSEEISLSKEINLILKEFLA